MTSGAAAVVWKCFDGFILGRTAHPRLWVWVRGPRALPLPAGTETCPQGAREATFSGAAWAIDKSRVR